MTERASVASAQDDFHLGVHNALRSKVKAAWTTIATTAAMAVMVSAILYISTSTRPVRGEGGRGRIISAIQDWAEWSHGWARPDDVTVAVIGLLTAALALFVATSLQPISPDISASGAAARILLDDVTSVVCLGGAVVGWGLSAGAGWHASTALAWGPGVATSVLLSVLAVSTERRWLTLKQRRWTLLRAQQSLRAAIIASNQRTWIRAFPWRWAAASAALATTPATVGIARAQPSISISVAVAVAVLTAMVMAWWLLLVAALWSSVSKMQAIRVRHGLLFPMDNALASASWILFLILHGVIIWSVGRWWGLLSFGIAVVVGLAAFLPWVVLELRQRQLLRQLDVVKVELASLTALAALAAERPTGPPQAVTQAPLPAEVELAWTLQVGRVRLLRFARQPRRD